MRPALEIDGGPVRRISRLVDGRRLTFLANPSADRLTLRVTPASSGSGALVGLGSGRGAARSLSSTDASTRRDAFTITLAAVRLALRARGRACDRRRAESVRIPLDGEWRVEPAGRRAGGRRAPDPRLWTDLGDGRAWLLGDGDVHA